MPVTGISTQTPRDRGTSIERAHTGLGGVGSAIFRLAQGENLTKHGRSSLDLYVLPIVLR